jgi:DNA-binding HxlR family transcriptional regulator
MRSYREYCPIARASEILAERWTPLVIRNLLYGCHTFTEIARGVPAMSRSLLIKRLKELERNGVIVKTADGTYQLTDAGADLAGVIEALEVWGERWLEITTEHTDPGFVLWAWAKYPPGPREAAGPPRPCRVHVSRRTANQPALLAARRAPIRGVVLLPSGRRTRRFHHRPFGGIHPMAPRDARLASRAGRWIHLGHRARVAETGYSDMEPPPRTCALRHAAVTDPHGSDGLGARRGPVVWRHLQGLNAPTKASNGVITHGAKSGRYRMGAS